MQRRTALLGAKALSTHWDATHATNAHVHGDLSQAFAAQLLLDRLQAGLRTSRVSVAASNLHYLRVALRATARDRVITCSFGIFCANTAFSSDVGGIELK
jgi:hypothetical protein